MNHLMMRKVKRINSKTNRMSIVFNFNVKRHFSTYVSVEFSQWNECNRKDKIQFPISGFPAWNSAEQKWVSSVFGFCIGHISILPSPPYLSALRKYTIYWWHVIRLIPCVSFNFIGKHWGDCDVAIQCSTTENIWC